MGRTPLAVRSTQTDALTVVVSESLLVRGFEKGTITAEISPEQRLLRGLQSRVYDPRVEHQDEEKMTVVSKDREKEAF